MTHKARIVYVPALSGYQLVCVKCGDVLANDIEEINIFEWPGNCEPHDTLGVSVKERIKSKDRFGG